MRLILQKDLTGFGLWDIKVNVIARLVDHNWSLALLEILCGWQVLLRESSCVVKTCLAFIYAEHWISCREGWQATALGYTDFSEVCFWVVRLLFKIVIYILDALSFWIEIVVIIIICFLNPDDRAVLGLWLIFIIIFAVLFLNWGLLLPLLHARPNFRIQLSRLLKQQVFI